MKKIHILNSIAFVSVIISFCCLFVITISVLKLPEVSSQLRRIENPSNHESLGNFGKMMIDMLPSDLAFTVFVPSENAFERDLKLRSNISFAEENINDTYAVTSRLLGFSAVPRHLLSAIVAFGKEISYDSISGYTLHVSKDLDGRMVVNGVRSEMVDLVRGEIVVHVMDGVIMDAEFQQSFQSAYGENEEELGRN